MDHLPNQTIKSDYESPRLTVICLRPEEAVLAVCKSLTHAGPASGSNPCFPFCASQIGS